MGTSEASWSVVERIREHALRVTHALGWYADLADCSVTHVPAPPDIRVTNPVVYWEVKVRLRAALNKHRPLSRDAFIAGMVRLSDNALLDTLAESSEALRARLQTDGRR